MKQTSKFHIFLFLLGVMSLSLIARPSFAYDGSISKEPTAIKGVEDTVNHETKDVEKRAQKEIKDTSREISKASKNAEATDAPKNKFDAKKTEKCEKKEKQISAKLDAISARGAKQLEVFHAIAMKVESFYVQKGYSADNYDALTAELDTLYDQSLVAVTSTQNASDAWDCNVQDPVASLNEFKVAKRAEAETLKVYKGKVHQLILLVKQAGGKTNED